MPRGGARDRSKSKEFHNRADGAQYAMSCAEVGKVLGITWGGVWNVERHAIRKLWRMTLPSCASSRFRSRRLNTEIGE